MRSFAVFSVWRFDGGLGWLTFVVNEKCKNILVIVEGISNFTPFQVDLTRLIFHVNQSVPVIFTT